jgi:hypothetical protein
MPRVACAESGYWHADKRLCRCCPVPTLLYADPFGIGMLIMACADVALCRHWHVPIML